MVSLEFTRLQISSVAVASIPPPMPSFYMRQQLILGPALNVTVREGDKALMPCVAPHLGDKTVSWIRQKDLAILTSGHHVYTSDRRVESIHPSASDLWGLQISPVRTSDEGLYQCQVNTEPKQSRTVVLVVLEQDLKDSPIVPAPPTVSTNVSAGRMPRISLNIIGGNQERTNVEGSNLTLMCSVILHEDGLYGKNVELAWWRGNVKLNSKNFGARVTSSQVVSTDEVTAELKIHFIQPSDAGIYNCKIEIKYFQEQMLNTDAAKQLSVKLNVIRKPVENDAFFCLPLPVLLILLVCCTTLFL
ncbi:hypothetical protein GHT06_018042 [Daphnia sinensis]|uniref:Ig-like domain-containing protein n=1 Tax=Daphnia sinensis TaxID=1820382 RepID=A0AAD5PQJ7_9CRUS|nr:hypothetical protein GHT06_018042 [Daphnia sinensis]